MGMFDQFQDKVALSESRTGAAAAVVTTSETGRCWNKSDPLFQHKSAATLFLREKRNMFKTIFLSFTHFCDRDTDALYWHEILLKKKKLITICWLPFIYDYKFWSKGLLPHPSVQVIRMSAI
jgi:hypothetical protein